MTTRITKAAARRIALAAQGFGRPRPEPWTATTRDLRRVIKTLRIIQIDSVNVLTRSQYLPFFSRLGPYDTGLLDRLRDTSPRALVEYWAHEASLVPPDVWPLFRVRMDHARENHAIGRENTEMVAAVRDEVAARGPITARQLEAIIEHDHDRARDHWGWNWSQVKTALEYLFWTGELSSAGRTSQFERRYAPPERVFAAADRHHITEQISPEDAATSLMEQAARAHGIASDLCLRDYPRIGVARAAPAIESLVAEGVLIPVTVEGWARPAYIHAEARKPRSVHARALLSPFDSLVWQRDRIEALWDFTYRIEIYTPAAKRVYGYYVLPFLLGDELVGRVDLKADRVAGVLRVQQVSWEPGRGGASDRAELDAELDLMADWLRLSQVSLPTR